MKFRPRRAALRPRRRPPWRGAGFTVYNHQCGAVSISSTERVGVSVGDGMLSAFQESLFQDLKGPSSYGAPLVGWKEQTEFFRAKTAPAHPGALPMGLPGTFIQQTYFLVRTTRPVTVYRGYETEGLKAPFGDDHPSFFRGLVSSRNPGKPDGRWWTPARPTLSIENLHLSEMHRVAPRAGAAVTKEWNRLDYWLEAELPPSALIYVGRASPQQEKAAYGGGKYGGGDFQFRLTESPEVAFRWMKRYATV